MKKIYGENFSLPIAALSEDHAAALVQKLKEKLGLFPTSSSVELAHVLARRGTAAPTEFESTLRSNYELNLIEMLDMLSLPYATTVYLSWRLRDFDEIAINLLVQNFDDIWYPSSDDLSIVDPQLRWMVEVSHYSSILVVRLHE